METKFYFWVGNKSGYLWTCDFNSKPKPKKGERLKYLGWTTTVGFPKVLNTGRILHNQRSYAKAEKLKPTT
jgi:hypothetical protein